jgi:hypothetical protein
MNADSTTAAYMIHQMTLENRVADETFSKKYMNELQKGIRYFETNAHRF